MKSAPGKSSGVHLSEIPSHPRGSLRSSPHQKPGKPRQEHGPGALTVPLFIYKPAFLSHLCSALSFAPRGAQGIHHAFHRAGAETQMKKRLLTPWLPHQPRQRDPGACPQRVPARGGRWVDLRPSSGPLQQKSEGRRLRRGSLRLPRKEKDPLGWV